MGLNGVGLEVKRIDLFQPGIFVGREHAVGLASLREHFVALEDHVVLEAVPGHAAALQAGIDVGIPGERCRLVVMVGKYRIGRQARGQGRHGVAGLALKHHQPRPGVARPRRQLLELTVQIDQRFPDELHPPVGARERGEDVAVKDKHAKDLFAGSQGVVKRRVVVRAQIPAKPHQAGLVFFGHPRMVAKRAVIRRDWLAATCWLNPRAAAALAVGTERYCA